MLDSDLTQVLLLCQDPLVRCGLSATLQEQPDFRLQPAGDKAPDVVVADYENGMALIAQYQKRGGHARRHNPKILIITQRDREWEIRQALESGIRGYLILGCDLKEVVDGVRFVKRGMRHICGQASRRLADSVACAALTSRETEVVRLVAEGRGNKAVARELDIAIGTVKSHLKAIFEKLGARSRTEVATVAKSRGLLDSPRVEHSIPVLSTPPALPGLYQRNAAAPAFHTAPAFH